MSVMLNLDKNSYYLLACSYGPDSMALFNMLLEEGYKFDVAFVNYHLRKESALEEENIKVFCASHNVKLYIRNVDQSEIKGNVEACCRQIRYSFFSSLSKDNKYDATLTGHQQDDLIETYIMQTRRKGLVDYYGIAKRTSIFDIKVIRPLLIFSKKFLVEYCDQNKVPYSIDITNLTDNYTRNKIRHSVVEKMSIKDRNDIIQEIELKNQKLEEIKANILKQNLNDCNVANRLSDLEFVFALIYLGREKKRNFTVSFKQATEIKKVLLSNKANISVFVHGLLLVKSYDKFFFDLPNESDSNYSFVVEKPMVLDTDFFYLDFRKDATNRNVHTDSYPLTIRNAYPEDVYVIKGYSKQMRRLFIDWKMPLYLRKRWPVILNKEGKLIYVPRYQKDFIPDDSCNFYAKY